MPMDDSERSLSDGGTFAGQPKVARDDVSLGDAATFAGSSKRRAADMSLGDERTFGDRLDDQETVIDDIEIVDLAARYRTEGTLGRGGMGEVLLALDTRLDRKVAIKRILGEAARSKTAVSRFLTEAKAIAALNHPNVVQIYDYGRAKDGPFLIMEYVDGSSLLDRCRDGALPLDAAVDLACQLCDGLGKAHDLGIVHRDIKPANVLLTKDGLPKLTDFGLAKAEAADHQMTMTGAVLGTPDFMPPEQRKDAALVDSRSDLWSLAATVYQMVTGRSPKIIRFDLLPAGLTGVLGKALEDAKDDRFQTARELRDALKASLAATAPAAAELGAGQCPSCGVKNDSSRRFCRACGESLEAPCLSCSKPMPMWEEICGQCGTKQGSLLEERRGEMAARQAEAESVLKDHEFEKAERITVALREESNPRLRQLVPWATAFLPRIAAARDAQLAQVAARVSEAGKHEASFDYPSAINALDQVPEILRERSLDGQTETVFAALARLTGKQTEVQRLESLVKERIAARELSGLQPEVEKLRVLRPDRHDVQKLCIQLEERQQKLIAQRDEALAVARSHLGAKDYESTLAVLRKIDWTVETPELVQVRATASTMLKQAQSLIADIRQAVADKRFDGLVPQVEKALALRPGHPELVKLLESLQARESKIASSIDELVAKAVCYYQECQFDKAVATLLRVPEDRRTDQINLQLDRCEYLAMMKSGAMARFEPLSTIPSLDTAEGVDLEGIVGQGRSYLAQIAEHGLSDQMVWQWCAKCDVALEKRRASERAYGWLKALRANLANVGSRVLALGQGLGAAASDASHRSRAWKKLRPVFSLATGLAALSLALGLLAYVIFAAWQIKSMTNGIEMELVEIKAGQYFQKIKRTVLPQDTKDLFIRSAVPIRRPFYIGSTEVTQSQWAAVMPTSPWRGRPDAIDGPMQPVTYVTAADGREFCQRLTDRERRSGAIGDDTEYRLPTEKEWEYACRGGTASNYYGGDDPGAVVAYDWCLDGSAQGNLRHPHDVGLKRPTRWGIYDAFGNVREICSDHVRGGCWTDPAEKCTTWRTTNASPTDGNASTGFRVILAPVE